MIAPECNGKSSEGPILSNMPPPQPQSRVSFGPPPPAPGTQIPPPQEWYPQHPPRGSRQAPVPRAARPTVEGSKSYVTTLVLSFFFGMFGADRFYLGKTRSALWKLFTFGGFGYWWLIDIVITLCGGQRDEWGFRLAGYGRYKKTVWKVIGAIYAGAFLLAGLSVVLGAAFVGGGVTAFGWVLIGIVAAATAAGGAIWFAVRRGARGKTVPVVVVVDPMPAQIRGLLGKLIAVRHLYVVLAGAGDQVAPRVVASIDSLMTNIGELFTRLSTKADASQRTLAEIEYGDKLGKLVAALDRDYLADLLAKPTLWDDQERRVLDVLAAMDAVDAELLNNIRQINAHRGMVFEVALDGLMGPRKLVDDWQRDFDRAAGAE